MPRLTVKPPYVGLHAQAHIPSGFVDFFASAIGVLQTLVVALGGGLCIWGGIHLLRAMVTITRVPMRRVHKEANPLNN